MKNYNISKSLTVYQGRVGGVRTTLGSFRENKHLKLYSVNCVNLGQNVPQALPQNPPPDTCYFHAKISIAIR